VLNINPKSAILEHSGALRVWEDHWDAVVAERTDEWIAEIDFYCYKDILRVEVSQALVRDVSVDSE
jgi:hypothetical protein